MKNEDREEMLPMELRVTVELPEELFREYSSLKHRRKLTGRVQQAIYSHELGSDKEESASGDVLDAVKSVSESVGLLVREMAEERKERREEMESLRSELAELKGMGGLSSVNGDSGSNDVESMGNSIGKSTNKSTELSDVPINDYGDEVKSVRDLDVGEVPENKENVESDEVPELTPEEKYLKVVGGQSEDGWDAGGHRKDYSEEQFEELSEEEILMKRLEEIQKRKSVEKPRSSVRKKPDKSAKKRLDSMMDI